MAPKNEWAEQDFYKILGVTKSSSESEIKKAYRKIARENHPDSNPNNKAAEEKFKAAAEAYDVLGDPKKRKEYDEFRDMIANGGFGPFGQAGGRRGGGGYTTGGFGGGQGGFNFSDLGDIFGGGGASRSGGFRSAGGTRGFSHEGDFGDIFGDMFSSSGARTATRPTRGKDVESQITLPFREAALGTTLHLQVTGDAPDPACHGSGSTSGKAKKCGHCNGTGYRSSSQGSFGFSEPCEYCGGTGEVISDPCKECGGTGTIHKTRDITVRIPAGVENGKKLRLAGKGEAGPNGTPAGDLFVKVNVTKDPVFSRKGDDLLVDLPVSSSELILGDTVAVPTLENPVRVKIPAGTPDGQVLRVRGRGIKKRSGEAGDLLVKMAVKIPKDLDAEATSALRAYAQAAKDSGFDPRAGWAGEKDL